MGHHQPDHREIPTGVTVAILTAFARPDEGGIQRSIEQLASGFGQTALVIAPPHPKAAQHDAAQPYRTIRRHLFGGPGYPTWGWIIAWAWRARRQGIRTIVFGHASGAAFCIPILRWFGLRTIMLVHGRDLLAEEARATKWLIRWALRRCDWVGVNSRYTAKLVQALGVPLGRIIRTHPAVPDQVLAKTTNREPHRILTVGRLVPRKNVGTVIAALAQAVKHVPDLHYDIVGDGPERSALEQQVKTLTLESHVTFHGALNDTQRDRLLDQADIFIMIPRTSEDATDVEGLGLVYLEAAARGIRCIASDNGGVRDVADPTLGHALVDPSDATVIANTIVQMCRDEQGTYSAARKEAMRSEFTWTVRTGRLLTAIKPELPAVSIGVVIPAYQASSSIGRTLSSVFSQTLAPKEVVIVDDGSTDDLNAAIAPWRERVTLVRQENAGAAAARNRGVSEIASEYIIFVDADITFEPDAFERMARVLITHPESAYAYPSFRFGPKGFHLHDFDPNRLRRMNYIHTTALIRRSTFPGFDPALKRFQDWDVWLTMLARDQTGIWVPAELFRVSQRGGTMSAWVPSIVYRLPFIGKGVGSRSIAAYRTAEQIIRVKHHLPSVADH